MINELDLLWVPNYIALGIFFIFGAKFSWNEGIDNCFNIKCVLLGRNFDFLVVTARYQEVTAGYRSLLLVPPFSMNRVYRLISSIPSNINFHIYNFSKVIKLFASLYFFVLFGLVGKNVHIY